MRTVSYALVALAAALWTAPVCAAGDPSSEYALRAAFVYNVMNFVEWPARAVSDASLRVVVVAESPLPSFVDALSRKRVGGRAISVSAVTRADQIPAAAVHVVFVALDAALQLPTVLKRLEGQPVLSIAEMDLDVQATTVVSLGVSEAKLGFRVNLDLADRIGLQLNPNLLRLAKAVQSARSGPGR